MRIQYLKPDPRAGMVAELFEDHAKRLIGDGVAKKVSADSESEAPPKADPDKAAKPVSKPAKKSKK